MASYVVITLSDGKNFIQGAKARVYVLGYPIVETATNDKGIAIFKLDAPPEAWGRYWVEYDGRTVTALAKTQEREVDGSINLRFGPEPQKPKGNCCFS